MIPDIQKLRSGLAAALATALLAACGGGTAPSIDAPAARTNNAYILQMAATKPAKGQRIDPNSPAVVAYMGYLARQQNAALASVGGGQKLYS